MLLTSMLGKTSQISFIYMGHFHSSQICLKRVYSDFS